MTHPILDPIILDKVGGIFHGRSADEAISLIQDFKNELLHASSHTSQFPTVNNWYQNWSEVDRAYLQRILTNINKQLHQEVHSQASYYSSRILWYGLMVVGAGVVYLAHARITGGSLANLNIAQRNIQLLESETQGLQNFLNREFVSESARNIIAENLRTRLEYITGWRAYETSTIRAMNTSTQRLGATTVTTGLTAAGVRSLYSRQHPRINDQEIINAALATTSYEKVERDYSLRIARQEAAYYRLIIDTNHLISHRPRKKCFISYSWEVDDKENKKLQFRLLKLKAKLEDIHCDVFLDVNDMNRPPRAQMQTEIDDADVVILICTPRLCERLKESRRLETIEVNAGRNPLNVELPAAFEFRITKNKLLAQPQQFKRIALHFSGDFIPAVPEEVRNIGATDIYGNSLTLNFTRFYNFDDHYSLASIHASYKAIAQRAALIDQLHFSGNLDHQQHLQYGGIYNMYKQTRSTKPAIHHLNYPNQEDLSDDEQASFHLNTGLTF